MRTMTIHRTVLTRDGERLILGEQLGAAGGEGAVYAVEGMPGKCVKIFHQPDPGKQAKIDAMIALARTDAWEHSRLGSYLAWPEQAVFRGRSFVGFVMQAAPRGAQPVSELYVYPPQNDLSVQAKLTCIQQVCLVTECLHAMDIVVGDFNPSNLLICQDWAPMFIDTDSFGIRTSGRVYKADTAFPGNTAPELLKKDGAACTVYSDRWGLALHIFRLLQYAHPYSLRSLHGPEPADLDGNVAAGRTAFFKTIDGYATPEYAPGTDALPPYLRDMFQKAFLGPAERRPAAVQWAEALRRFSRDELQTCRADPSHAFWSGADRCPYCEAAARWQRKAAAALAVPAPASTARQSKQGRQQVRPAWRPRRRLWPRLTASLAPSDRRFLAVTGAICLGLGVPLACIVMPSFWSSVFSSPSAVTAAMVVHSLAMLVTYIWYASYWIQYCWSWTGYLIQPLAVLGVLYFPPLFKALLTVSLTIMGTLLLICFAGWVIWQLARGFFGSF